MKTFQSIIFSFIICYQVIPEMSAQESQEPSQVEEWMYKATENNSAILWNKIITLLEEDQANKEAQLQLAYAYYGLTSVYVSTRQKKEGQAALENGIAHAEHLIEKSLYESEANAILAGLYGLSIALSPMKGMYLGPKSDRHIETSLELDEQCAFAWFQKGNSQFNTPRMFGGNPSKSVVSLEKAVSIYSTSITPKNWQKIIAMVWLGRAYHKTGQIESAIGTYNLVLKEMPNFRWVKEILLPQALQSE